MEKKTGKGNKLLHTHILLKFFLLDSYYWEKESGWEGEVLLEKIMGALLEKSIYYIYFSLIMPPPSHPLYRGWEGENFTHY
jgi:hypothetical protein